MYFSQVQRNYGENLRQLQDQISDLQNINIKLNSVTKWNNLKLKGKCEKEKGFIQADAERQVRLRGFVRRRRTAGTFTSVLCFPTQNGRYICERVMFVDAERQLCLRACYVCPRRTAGMYAQTSDSLGRRNPPCWLRAIVWPREWFLVASVHLYESASSIDGRSVGG